MENLVINLSHKKELQELYDKAVKEKQDFIIFKNHKLYCEYLKYLLEYLNTI